MANVVVLGAGVSGLTTALLLARNGHSVSIVAKYMPGDYSIEYCSPWAGANWMPVGTSNSLVAELELATWPEFERLAQDLPETGIHFQECRVLKRSKDAASSTTNWFAELLHDDKRHTLAQRGLIDSHRELAKNELPVGYESGISFNSVCINTALYLPWLASQCLKFGANLRRGVVEDVADAAKLHHSGSADIVVNCTGLSSLHLGGVEDKSLYPGRGQVVVVRNDPGRMYGVSGTDDGKEETTYMMNRGAGGGCILGGCLQPNNWESEPDPYLAIRIMKRCVELRPELVDDGESIDSLSIIRHGVGLRPMRKEGIRLETENNSGVSIVHNYGHAGYGYQTSYGAAEKVKELINEALRQRAES